MFIFIKEENFNARQGKIQETLTALIKMTDEFCDKYLDEDYRQLCRNLILKMSRKQNVPFLSGRLEIWAGAVIHSLGTINFLFDRNSKPYVTVDDISNHFGTSKSTVSQNE
jgi:hypothetical protein